MTEADRLRAGIQAYLDGNYDYPRKHRPNPCQHGIAYYEACERCIDAHFIAVMEGTWKPKGGDAN